MPFATAVVPMPKWSTPVGCTKLVLSILVLAFVAACTAIWGAYPAFAISLLAASLSLVVFGYYLTALSFLPKLYNKVVVLILESILTLLWFVSLIMLAGWVGASTTMSRWIWGTTQYTAAPYGPGPEVLRRDFLDEMANVWASPFAMVTRRAVPGVTPVNVHGQDAHTAAQILAGISAGMAGITFILYAVTLAAFANNFSHTDSSPNSITVTDEEAQQSSRETSDNTESTPPTTNPPAISQPLRVNTLPKGFDPKPQTQEYYLNAEDTTKAGIQPPAPVLEAQQAERERTPTMEEKGEAKEEPETVLLSEKEQMEETKQGGDEQK